MQQLPDTPKERAEKLLERILPDMNLPTFIQPVLKQYCRDFSKQSTDADIISLCENARKIADFIQYGERGEEDAGVHQT